MNIKVTLLQQFMAGAICMGYAVIGLFFLKFWRRTRDQLFLIFAIALWLLAALRFELSMLAEESELRTFLYMARLFAFVLILWAIYRKNRESRQPHT